MEFLGIDVRDDWIEFCWLGWVDVGWLDIPCLKSAFLSENLATMSQSSKIQVPCLCLT